MVDVKVLLRKLVARTMNDRLSTMSPGKRRKKAAAIIRGNYPLVLMYHSVNSQKGSDPYTITTKTLERNIIELLEDGYSFVFENEYFHCPAQSVILTFDDGFMNNYTELFPLLKKYNVKASINMIADKISEPDYLTEAQIVEMERSGLVQFQSHTCSHRSLNQIPIEEAVYEIKESKRKLDDILCNPVTIFVYPREDVTEEIARVASEVYDLCYGWGGYFDLDKRYTLPRIEIREDNSDYASIVLREYQMIQIHDIARKIQKNAPQVAYRRVLFLKDDI